jgi:cell pole-organizing protein PopZ
VREGAPNGKTHSLAVPGAAETTQSPAANPPTTNPQAANPSQLQGLDAMVADLLRPMLRRWLDENMPRLVSAALKAEAETVSRRDPKKP